MCMYELNCFCRGGEARCLKRSDLIKALADALPPETVRFGYKVVAVTMDPKNMFPTLTLNNGSSIRAKVSFIT